MGRGRTGIDDDGQIRRSEEERWQIYGERVSDLSASTTTVHEAEGMTDRPTDRPQGEIEGVDRGVDNLKEVIWRTAP